MASSFSNILADAACGEDVKERINFRMNNVFIVDDDGELRPYVCTVCDEFILRGCDVDYVGLKLMKKASNLLSWSQNFRVEERIPALEQYYRFPPVAGTLLLGERNWIDNMALSPRGYFHRSPKTRHFGFVTCSCCKEHLSAKKPKMPFYAIANHHHVGSAPKELLDLTDIERTFLTPIRSYGYFFTYEGGAMKQMKGSMTFMRVEERKIAKAVTTLETMGLTKHVVIMISGNMTEAQHKKAKKLSEFRTDKMIAAVKWLCANHRNWRHVNLNEIIDEIGRTKPIRIEKVTTVQSGNAVVEDEVVFTCYYPDGATNTHTGGFSEPEEFKSFVEEMKAKNFDVQLKANIEKNFVQTSDGDLLIGASLLQFPYGVGSMEETRLLPDGKTISKCDLSEFLSHLSQKADPVFQESLFQLIMYSVKNKTRLLRSSGLQLKYKFDATVLAEGFNAKDFSKACSGRRGEKKRRRGTKLSNKVLDAVDATAKDLPHTDQAAKTARSSMESMFHHLGLGSVFLTVTFDDENSLLVQVLSGVQVDKGESIDDLSDEELAARASKRATIRYEFPGIAAINFEILMNILLEEVLCWDVENDCPIEGKKSFCGKLKAVAFSVEEQGRKTIHVHFILWVEDYNELQQAMFFGSDDDQREAKYIAQRFYDHLATTSLFPTKTNELRNSFDHDGCTVASKNREPPQVLCDQELRYLRHKNGYEKLQGEFASCPHCPKKWTYEQLLEDYLKNEVGITDKVTVPTTLPTSPLPESKLKQRQLPKERLYAKIVEFQHPSKGTPDEPTACINAAYQSHASCHHKNCFKCTKLTGKKKKSHVCGKHCECRYRLPDKKRQYTQVQTQHEGTTWYEWTGEKKLQPLLMFLPKRNTYDLFQNVACPAISNSKFTCNSNVAVITDGPIGMYSCKYINKPNEKDDTTEYAQVEATMKKMDGEGRKHENDKSEALRIICRAAFAHNRTNVVSASLASYLTRHDSRFYFSLTFKYCPLRDLVRLHNKQEIGGTVAVSADGSSYLENQALHYLCRPGALEHLNLKVFTEKWEITYVTAKNKDEVLPFEVDTGFYRHPSATEKGRGKKKVTECRQGVKLRATPLYAKFPQWGFPDAEGFRGNILTCAEEDITRAMESFAQMALTLLVPHRNAVELMVYNVDNYPYVHKLRQLYEDDSHKTAQGLHPDIFTQETLKLLQNIQNSAYNCTRYKGSYDELASTTVPLENDEMDGIRVGDESEDEDDEGNSPDTGYEEFLECLDDEFNRPLHDDDPNLFQQAMNNFSFKHIRDHGDDRCGYKTDFDLPDLIPRGEDDPFVKTTTTATNQSNSQRQPRRQKQDRKTYTVKEITAVLLKRTTKSHRNVWKGKTIDVEQATGSIRSIREWSIAGFGKDKKQQRAFEAIIAAFLLTFYEDEGNGVRNDNNDTEVTMQEKLRFRRTRTALLKLKGNPLTPQMICLLHGPGGSGKSTVINMVTAYAKSFCEMLNHPFDNRTITLTAMSGVAATLLHGETTHWALGMNKKTLPQKMRDQFADARLIVIDEISFASAENVAKIHDCLKFLMGKSYRRFGGVNVVFAGDFSQLDPVRCKHKLYDTNDIAEWNHSLNCFIELDGTHRFVKDPKWGKCLLRFRKGTPTHNDINLINNTCHVSVKAPPKNIQVATAYNRNRDAINSGIFEDWCEEHKPQNGAVLTSACVILMDDLEMSTSVGSFVPVESNQVKHFFYGNCSENDCKLPEDAKGRVDPVLKLYPGCPVMLTQNNDVLNGQANGSRLTLKQIIAKPDEQPFPLKLDCGTTINALFASQVDTLVLEHVNDDIEPRVFMIEAENWTFSTKLEVGDVTMKVNMRGHQFPIISNSCTTGHKLQGCGLDEILVNDWMYKQNWAYVVLSRVRTMDGLYIRQELSHDLKKYQKSEKMVAMLKDFEERLSLVTFNDNDYDTMIRDTEP